MTLSKCAKQSPKRNQTKLHTKKKGKRRRRVKQIRICEIFQVIARKHLIQENEQLRLATMLGRCNNK